MKIGIISDTHFGDSTCKLLDHGVLGKVYEAFRNEVIKFTGGPSAKKRLSYLVLNGDTLDFSINPFYDSCQKARPFFRALQQDNLAEKIILIPGNHDKQIWDVVEWERHVTMKMQQHEDPEPFTRTQPVLLDLATGEISLPGVSPRSGATEPGGLFLEGLFSSTAPSIGILVAYPNLYIKAPDATYLVTHGHMLDSAWVLLSELMGGYPSVSKATKNHIGLYEFEELNKPLSDLICSAIGQGGPVSEVFYKIQLETKNGRTGELKDLFDWVCPKLDALIELPWYAEGLDNAFLFALKKVAVAIVDKGKSSRYDVEFYDHQSVRDRFARFYEASCEQARDKFQLDPPNRVIFGHTHEPIEADSPKTVTAKELPQIDFGAIKDRKLLLYNTGGWLKDVEGKSADVFFFDDNGSLTSVNIL
jgi:UDP-2,3-diacylglucosamine pyrophosphatase LpxH